MNARERFLRVMHFKKSDRIPFYEFFGYWGGTIDRWYKEGLPRGEPKSGAVHYDYGYINRYFGFDKKEYVLTFGSSFWYVPLFETKILEENERYKIQVGEDGIIHKVLKEHPEWATQRLDFPVKTPEDFEKIKERFNPHDPRRYPENWAEKLIEHYKTVDCPVGIEVTTGFALARLSMGIPGLLTAFFKNPDFVHEMFDFYCDFIIETARKAVEEVKIDFAIISEDQADRHGHFLSPKLFLEFMLPYYKRITGFLRKNGIDIIMVDSDGNLNLTLPLFLEAGVNGFVPLEVAAGMDVVQLRKEYDRQLLMIGNIDKRALIEGKEAIEREVNRKIPVAKEGGYIPSVDHSVPEDVPFQNYEYYIDLLKKSL